MSNSQTINPSQNVEMPRRQPGWCFGPPHPYSREEAAWWKRHEPTVDRWIGKMEARNDPWWQSAEHAAFCLAGRNGAWRWDRFCVHELLFRELWEGGTVGLFGSTQKFFEHLLEALERFVADGLVPASSGARWLGEMREAREDFLRCYASTTATKDAIAIAQRRLSAAL